jgi:hypothetical protein
VRAAAKPARRCISWRVSRCVSRHSLARAALANKAGSGQDARQMSMDAVLTACTDDTLLGIANALPRPADLLRLVLTCRAAAKRFYFNQPCWTGSGSSAAGGSDDRTWSIVEEAARQQIAGLSAQERSWGPGDGPGWTLRAGVWLRAEGRLGLLNEMELLRRAAVFGRSHESITLTDGGALATRTGDGWGYDRGATSGVAMRAGQHYAQFTVVAGSRMMFGVVRPRWDVEGGHDAALDRQHRFYATAGGYRLPRFTGFYDDWPGQQPAREPGDRIGLLLDLEQGSMTVYKNDERLGVIQESGLRGEYCWAAELASVGDSVRIEPAAIPPDVLGL